jgi:hypothetical protein
VRDPAHQPGVEALRAEFDAAFGAPPRRASQAVGLLAIRIGNAAFAVRLLQAGGLVTVRAIAPVPSRRPELLGIAALRGEVLPVYSLARLVLRADDVEPPRWLILAGAPDRVALAFAAFDGHLVAAASDLHPLVEGEGRTDHVMEIQAGAPARPVLSLPSLVAAITGR